MNSLVHPNILKLRDSTSTKIYTDFMPNKDLFTLIQRVGGAFSEHIAQHFFVQLISSVIHMHHVSKICHRDLKVENIFVDEDFNINLGDFGYSEFLGKSSTFCDRAGTISYMTPEQILGREYKGIEADLFACGVILHVMVTG